MLDECIGDNGGDGDGAFSLDKRKHSPSYTSGDEL